MRMLCLGSGGTILEAAAGGVFWLGHGLGGEGIGDRRDLGMRSRKAVADTGNGAQGTEGTFISQSRCVL